MGERRENTRVWGTKGCDLQNEDGDARVVEAIQCCSVAHFEFGEWMRRLLSELGSFEFEVIIICESGSSEFEVKKHPAAGSNGSR
jgi:hypothetical protein